MATDDPNCPPPYISYLADQAVTAFMKVCMAGDLSEVRRLAVGDHAPSRRFYLSEGLRSAVMFHQLDVIRYLLGQGAEIGSLLTAVAAREKSLPIFKIFAERGWDVNTSFNVGYTTLGFVIPDEETARWFLAQGANPNLGPRPDPFTDSSPSLESIPNSGDVLEVAAAESSPEFFDVLLQHGAILGNSLALHQIAAREGTGDKNRIPMMEHLLNLGVDINGSDAARGYMATGTPLHIAIEYSALDNARLLLSRGADIKLRDCKRGLTALELAKHHGRQDMIDLIQSFSP